MRDTRQVVGLNLERHAEVRHARRCPPQSSASTFTPMARVRLHDAQAAREIELVVVARECGVVLNPFRHGGNRPVVAPADERAGRDQRGFSEGIVRREANQNDE